jgi:prophage regulatory protein
METLTSLPETGLIRLSTVLRFIPISKSTWWDGVKKGRFPQAVKLGPRTTCWKVEDIRKLIDSGWKP